MKPLIEIETNGESKVLLIGEPGVGKTIQATSYPYPIRVLDFDRKVDSAALYWRQKGDVERLKNIQVTQFSTGLDGESPIDALTKIFANEFIPQQRAGKMEFQTLVLDSITTFSSATLRHIVKSNPGIKRTMSAQGAQPGLQDFGILSREFERIIQGLLSLPCNVVMCAHISVEKDEATGQIMRHATMDGSFARKLPALFKEVWRLYVKDGKRMAQTQSDHMFNCRSQIPGLPNPLDVTNGYDSFKQYIGG